MDECPFCAAQDRLWLWRGETIFYEDHIMVIVRAKDMKGHKERLLAVVRAHIDFNPALESYLTHKLKEVGAAVFRESFIILEDTFSRFTGHAHKIACLLDKRADDYQQMLNTEFESVRV